MRYGFKLGGAGLANALASLIVDSTHTKATKEIGVVMHANGIEVAPIVHDRFLAALRQSNAFVVSDSGADGTFVLSVRQHGFDSPGLKFSTKLPFLVLEGQLLNKDGKRVWRGESVLGHLRTKDIGATWEDYKQHPEKLRADWQAQADSVIEGLMQFQKTP
jgi:hypothetical protein